MGAIGTAIGRFFDSPGFKFFLICGIVHPVLYGLLCLILRLED